MKPSARRPAAWLALLAVVFAQVALSSHVYAFGLPGSVPLQSAAAFPYRTLDPDHCAGHVKRIGLSSTNLCEAHCSNSAPPVAAFELSKMAPPALVVSSVNGPLFTPVFDERVYRQQQMALPRAPPLILQFCRLLI